MTQNSYLYGCLYGCLYGNKRKIFIWVMKTQKKTQIRHANALTPVRFKGKHSWNESALSTSQKYGARSMFKWEELKKKIDEIPLKIINLVDLVKEKEKVKLVNIEERRRILENNIQKSQSTI